MMFMVIAPSTEDLQVIHVQRQVWALPAGHNMVNHRRSTLMDRYSTLNTPHFVPVQDLLAGHKPLFGLIELLVVPIIQSSPQYRRYSLGQTPEPHEQP